MLVAFYSSDHTVKNLIKLLSNSQGFGIFGNPWEHALNSWADLNFGQLGPLAFLHDGKTDINENNFENDYHLNLDDLPKSENRPIRSKRHKNYGETINFKPGQEEFINQFWNNK